VFDECWVIYGLVKLIETQLRSLLSNYDAELSCARRDDANSFDRTDTTPNELLHVWGERIVNNVSVSIRRNQRAGHGT